MAPGSSRGAIVRWRQCVPVQYRQRFALRFAKGSTSISNTAPFCVQPAAAIPERSGRVPTWGESRPTHAAFGSKKMIFTGCDSRCARTKSMMQTAKCEPRDDLVSCSSQSQAAGTTLECSSGVACCSTILVLLLAKCELQRNLFEGSTRSACHTLNFGQQHAVCAPPPNLNELHAACGL